MGNLERRALPAHPDRFADRHIGPRDEDVRRMLESLGLSSLDQLVDRAVPASIRLGRPLELEPAVSERDVMSDLAVLAGSNKVFRSYLGLGYHDCITPAVIRRTVLENPGWYT